LARQSHIPETGRGFVVASESTHIETHKLPLKSIANICWLQFRWSTIPQQSLTSLISVLVLHLPGKSANNSPSMAVRPQLVHPLPPHALFACCPLLVSTRPLQRGMVPNLAFALKTRITSWRSCGKGIQLFGFVYCSIEISPYVKLKLKLPYWFVGGKFERPPAEIWLCLSFYTYFAVATNQIISRIIWHWRSHKASLITVFSDWLRRD
jgi:hypothetical protein